MTDDIKRLRELCDAATPGPWAEQHWKGAPDGCVYAGNEWIANASIENAALIAAARTALPALLDRLEAVERERDEAKAACRSWATAHDEAIIADRDTLKARLERAEQAETKAVTHVQHLERQLAACKAELEAERANAVRMREYRFSLEGIATDGNGNPVESTRDCTCLGSCRGADTLAPGWRCALARRER